jgi:hypothetical protein
LADTRALERVLRARIEGGEQGAHVGEELQRVTAGEPPTGVSQQVGRAGPLGTRGVTLPLARWMPGLSTARPATSLGHRWQPTGAATADHPFRRAPAVRSGPRSRGSTAARSAIASQVCEKRHSSRNIITNEILLIIAANLQVREVSCKEARAGMTGYIHPHITQG